MKTLIAVALLISSLTPLAHAAGEVIIKDNAFAIPQGKGGSGPDTQAKWSLPSISRSDSINTAVLAGLGTGAVRGVCVIADTIAGGYVSLYDTISPAGLTAADGGTGSYLGSFWGKILVAGYDTNKQSCEWFDRPIPFSAGLAWIASATNVRAVAIYDTIKQP